MKFQLILLFILLFSISVFAITDTNLIAYYNFDQASGNLIDQTGNSHTGTNTNTVQDTNGKILKSTVYNGTNAYTDLNGTSFPTTKMSMAMWFKTKDTSSNDVFYQQGTYAVNQFEISNNANASTDGITCTFASGDSAGIHAGISYDNNNWHLVVCDYNGSGLTMYVDNVLIGSQTKTGAVGLTAPRFANYSGMYYTGQIDEVSIWGRSLSASDVNQLWNNGAALSYPFTGAITSSFTHTITKSTQTISLTDTSSDTNSTINDWNWLKNGLSFATTQNTSFIAIANTDYNICLIVKDTGLNSSSSCQTINSGRFYGDGNFYFINELTGAALTGVTLTFQDINYSTGATNFYDLNMQLLSSTSTRQTIYFSKSGYGTRYYTADLNTFSDINKSILMFNDTNGLNTNFTFFAPDQTTLLSNATIQVRKYGFDTNTIVSQAITGSDGATNFFLWNADSNYHFYILASDGNVYDYNSISVTVNKPFDEATNTAIVGNWDLRVSGVAVINDLNITTGTNQALLVYANTTNAYVLNVSSRSLAPVYYARNFTIQYVGNPSAQTLQPYLISTTGNYQSAIKTQSLYSLLPIGNVDIKIKKLLPGGMTVVEEEITNSSGDAVASMQSGQAYIFEVYIDNVLNQTLTQTGASAAGVTIYINIGDINPDFNTLNTGSITTTFTPVNNALFSSNNTLTQVISLNSQGSNLAISQIIFYITNTDVNGVTGNDVNVYYKSVSTSATTYTNNIDINNITQIIDSNASQHYDTNGTLVVYVVTVTNDGIVKASFVYSPYRGLNIVYGLNQGLKPLFGCTADSNGLIPCAPLLILALFISILVAVSLSASFGYVNLSTIGIMFIFMCGVFTFFAWIPVYIFALMFIGTLGLIAAEAGRRM